MSTVVVRCPHCEKELKLRDEYKKKLAQAVNALMQLKAATTRR